MSNTEKALGALQTIINLTSCHTASKVNDEVISLSETIRQVLAAQHTDTVAGGLRVSCFYAGMPGQTVPVSEAQGQYNACDQMCQNCGGRCQ